MGQDPTWRIDITRIKWNMSVFFLFAPSFAIDETWKWKSSALSPALFCRLFHYSVLCRFADITGISIGCAT